MAFYPIAFLVTAPLIGDKLNSLGRKNSLLVGILVMTLATLTFGMAGYSHNSQIFFAISMIGRIF